MGTKNISIGVHFGHDAAIAILSDDGLTYEAQERVTRIKHAIGVDTSRLLDLLKQSGDVRALNISSTQDIPIFFDDQLLDVGIDTGGAVAARNWFAGIGETHHYQKFIKWSGTKLLGYSGVRIAETSFGWANECYAGSENSYAEMSMVHHGFDFSQHFKKSGTALIKSTGASVDVTYWQHHFLHAMYAAGSVGKFKPSIIITGDGAIGPSYAGGGIYFFHPETGLRPIIPTNGWVGHFYDHVAKRLGLGDDGGAGKLMGLAPYGRAIYFDESFIGTKFEVCNGDALTIPQKTDVWLNKMGYNSEHANWDKSTASPPKFVSDIAASAQLIFEINQLKIVDVATTIAKRSGFAFEYIMFSGGCALNCPSNSNIQQKYSNFVIPPAVNDEGLAIASAIIGWKDMTGSWPTVDLATPYMGYDLTEVEMDRQAAEHGYVKVVDNSAARCVDMLLAGKLVAVASGKSEVGPRALGHRSLVADPSSLAAWEKVNQAKKREMWRPLAPFVLDSHFSQYFDNGPSTSNYMLFNHRVKTKQFPAITHYDHSARVQTVGQELTAFWVLLQEMVARGRAPVLLNTSLNGPAEPIAENEKDVFNIARGLGLTAVFTGAALYVKE